MEKVRLPTLLSIMWKLKILVSFIIGPRSEEKEMPEGLIAMHGCLPKTGREDIDEQSCMGRSMSAKRRLKWEEKAVGLMYNALTLWSLVEFVSGTSRKDGATVYLRQSRCWFHTSQRVLNTCRSWRKWNKVNTIQKIERRQIAIRMELTVGTGGRKEGTDAMRNRCDRNCLYRVEYSYIAIGLVTST